MWKDKNIKRTPQIAHKIKLEILSKSAKLLLWLQVKKKKKKIRLTAPFESLKLILQMLRFIYHSSSPHTD